MDNRSAAFCGGSLCEVDCGEVGRAGHAPRKIGAQDFFSCEAAKAVRVDILHPQHRQVVAERAYVPPARPAAGEVARRRLTRYV